MAIRRSEKVVAEIRDQQWRTTVERRGHCCLSAMGMNEPVVTPSGERPISELQSCERIRKPRAIPPNEEHVAPGPSIDQRFNLPLDEHAVGIVILIRPAARDHKDLGAWILSL
jgi:hypothetical protein